MRFIRHSECSYFRRSFLQEVYLFKALVFLLQINVRAKSIENRLPSRARVQCFLIFAFTSSPDGGMWLYMSWLSVKVKAIYLHLLSTFFMVSVWELDV